MASITGIKVPSERRVLAADTLTGDKVVNLQNEDLGKIEHLMIDLGTGRIAYAVLSFGGFLGMGDKLFAIPWSALVLDTVEKRFILNEMCIRDRERHSQQLLRAYHRPRAKGH